MICVEILERLYWPVAAPVEFDKSWKVLESNYVEEIEDHMAAAARAYRSKLKFSSANSRVQVAHGNHHRIMSRRDGLILTYSCASKR
tara:strand:+ start:316 stop:576 length:261 start_codon:yes stop_codon:yes gene_type:complete